MTAGTESARPNPLMAFARRGRAAVLGDREAGWWTVAAKELTDHLVSARFTVLLIILSLVGATTVYLASDALTSAAQNVAANAKDTGTTTIFLALFTVGNGQVPPFVALIAFLVPLIGVAFGFDAINGERAGGTLSRLLAQPIYRDDVINGKFVGGLAVIGVTLVAVTAIVAGLGMFRLGIVPDAESVLRLAVWLVIAIIYVGFWLAFATLCSVAFRRAATSALAAIGTWIFVALFGVILVTLIAGYLSPLPSDATGAEQLANSRSADLIGNVSPAVLFQSATQVILDPSVRWTGSIDSISSTQASGAVAAPLSLDQSLLLIWPQVVALIAFTTVSFAAAYILFMRQEVRA